MNAVRGWVGRHGGAAIGLAALALVLVWVAYRAYGDPATWIVVTLAGLTLGSLYFIISSGFTLIFGLMRVVNMAHGSFYLLAGYITFEMQLHGTISWGWSVVVAVLIVGLGGLVMQQLLLRWNYGQDMRQALITIAVSYIMADQMLSYIGGVAEDVQPAAVFQGSANLHVYGLAYSWFRLFVLLCAAAVGVGLVLLIRRTRFGMIVRAGVDDRAMVSALGINVQRVFGVAFFLGSALAGLGGALAGGMVSLAPGEDANFLLKALIVVIIGGMGSLG
ncbi:MAG TPA: branched-chain amino acid ABC transporter permease, partial [Polyangiaceae bacterium]|nr:branched-chain amino acid ABC transporter permease [Polyangiaceae bacterium]